LAFADRNDYVILLDMEKYSIYLHIPFCRHRCGYCDFNTYAGIENRIPAYIEALCQEIRKVSQASGQLFPVHTIFWGGGTPSLIPTELLEQVLSVISESFELLPGLENTLEANPGTVTPAYLQALRGLGFNRISYGMQSARPDELRLLERQHTIQDVIEAVRWSREAGFDSLNLDLIYALPGQTLDDWQHTLEFAIRLQPEHLSLYSLTIEEGTPMARWRSRGLIPEPEEDTAADMYEWAGERLEGAGFEQYEISNWARRDASGSLLACRHNLQYWQDRPYFGFGAGAHGYIGDTRMANARGVNGYIRMVQELSANYPTGPAAVDTWPVDDRTAMQETMMVGLRLVQAGVTRASFAGRFGRSLDEVFHPEIQDLVGKGLLEDDGERVRLTRRGRLLGNRVFMQFVGD
jgi:oxygen-independent coproporphyrinogen III oxidase